jgi:hypothetical protein
MVRLRIVRSLALCLASVAAISCADHGPTAPSADVAPNTSSLYPLGSRSAAGGPNTLTTTRTDSLYPAGYPVTAVRWAPTHIVSGYRVSAVIRSEGGTISVPGADFSITFPFGALSKPTLITIIADDGAFVSYDMLPHGIRFRKPVIVTQRLLNTVLNSDNTAAQNSQGAYLPDGKDGIGNNGQATTVEKLRSTTTWTLQGGLWVPQSQTWLLRHFSRYILASG